MLKIWRPSLALEFLIPYIWGWPKNPYCYQSGHVILWFILRLENEWANHFYPWTTSSSWQFVLREPSFCRSPHLPAPCSSSPPAFFPVRGTLSPGLRGGGGGAVGPWMEEKRGPWEEGLLEDAEVNCPFLTTLHRASAVQSEDPVIWNKSGLSGAYCLQQGLTILLKKKKKKVLGGFSFTQLHILICKVPESIRLPDRSYIFKYHYCTLKATLFISLYFLSASSPVCSICLFWVTFALVLCSLLSPIDSSVHYLLCIHLLSPE